MTIAITLSASKEEIARYHSLLTSEWTRHSPEEVLSLLRAEIAESDAVRDLPFGDVLRSEIGKFRRHGMNEGVVNHIRTFAGFFERRVLPEMPSPEALADARRGRLLAQAETVWTYLVLHSLVRLRGETGFFLDTQSLLFLTTVHYLLPALKEQRPAHDCLVNALSMHAVTAWRGQPEHFFYLQSVLMDYLGDEMGTEENLRLALELTPPEDESYLTKVQDYWYALLDAGKPRDAWSLLLSVYRNAPQPYLEELEEMMAVVGRRLPPEVNASAKRR